jgi:hypothetical protein
MLTTEIKEKIKELYDSTPEGVGVTFGKKVKDNHFTGELGFVFLVEKKKPKSELTADEILPNKVMVGSEGYVTDVVQSGKIVNFACDPATLSACYGWQSVTPSNNNFQRPLKGGLGITSSNLAGYVGTLGLICKDTATGALVGLTNQHVVVKDSFFTGYRTPYGLIDNEINDPVYQPASQVNNPTYEIGRVLRYQPLHPKNLGMNYIDTAVISIKSDVVDLAQSYKQFGITGYTSYMDFASTAEIDNLLVSDPPLISSGRTTGVKETSPCDLTVSSIGSVGEIWNSLQGYDYPSEFDDCIVIKRQNPDCTYPIAPGDSGSALIANFGGTYKIIGLVFAGAVDGSFGIACRIDRIASSLAVEPWLGGPVNYINPDSIQIITAPRSTNKTLECDGLTYWQVGLSSYNNPCTTTTTTTP